MTRSASELPAWRWRLLLAATLLALCVYYLNYDGSFVEGEITGGSPLTLVFRLASVAILVVATLPWRFRPGPAWPLVAAYLVAGAGMLGAVGLAGSLNDSFFVNTLVQLPVLIALASTKWRIDHVRWLRFIGAVLCVQAMVDAALWVSGASLWQSAAFIGGVGNPSSFGLLCSVLFAFYMLHPDAGRGRRVFAGVLGIAAVMSLALFAVLAVAVVVAIWASRGWRRMVFGVMAGLVMAIAALTLLAGTGDDGSETFLEHKLNAAGALFGLVEYDVDSSATVSQRLQMHEDTLDEIVRHPMRLLWGHLQGKPYWPMDSQLLTYLGSFGLLMLALFLIVHVAWLAHAIRIRKTDQGFTMWALALFTLIFATNRILDYFPVATMYFLVATMASRTPLPALNGARVASLVRSARGNTRWSARARRGAAP